MKTRSDVAWKLRRALNHVGLDVVPYRHTRHPIARRSRLFARYGIDLVLDVGANSGQYGRFLRNIGYAGRILSFEPLSSAYAALEETRRGDALWDARRLALGDREGTVTLNVSHNSESSSLLPMLPTHLEAYPESRYVTVEQVPMTTLARVIGEAAGRSRTFLKIDAQGYESRIIEGAGGELDRVAGVQIEMSIVPLYEGERLMHQMIPFIADRGLVLMSLEPGASDQRTGQLLQVDGLFFRPGSALS